MTPETAASTDRKKPGFRRVLVIGLDGATFDVLGPLMEDGVMPVLKSMVEEGASGVLESTKPPITPAAWTTFMTGKSPGRHGIIDFLRYDPGKNQLVLNNNQKISQTTIWQILSEKNYKVGAIHVPMTFPPEPVNNGFIISGFDTPPGEDFTYPKKLQAEILAKYPDYTHEKRWERKAFGGNGLFAQNLEYVKQSFDRGYDLARFCGDQYGWDVMMVLLKLVDNLQHKTWRYLDERFRGRNPVRRKLTLDCFARLDQVIGRLKQYAADREAAVLIMSDHGHGSLDGKAQPNLLLARWGYLGLRSGLARAVTRGQVWWRRLTRSNNNCPSGQQGTVDQDLAFEWSRTRACVLHAGIYGFLYINLKGRQPDGIVEPAEFEPLREEIRQKLLAVRYRRRDGQQRPVFPEVHTTEELYGCGRKENPWMPDLLLVPDDGLAVVKKIRGGSAVRWIRLSRVEGTHRLEGVFLAHGPGIARGVKIRAQIADIAPTILAGLGERVPKDMDGQVVRDIFHEPVTVRYEPPQERRLEEAEAPALTKAQLEEVATRLGDLGYLD